MSKYFNTPFVGPFFRATYGVYQKIAEPRVKRLIYFVIYILLGTIGGASAFTPNVRIQELLGGMGLIYFFGGLIIAGAFLCLFSVLPGIWVFERAGLVGLGTGIVMYTITLVCLGASLAITLIPSILILVFVLRWLDIKDYLLAPRKG
jgi:hypothetical protein